MFTFMKVMIMVMALTASNETYDRIVYIEHPTQEVEFELIDAYVIDMETGEKTPINVTVLEAD